MSEYILQVPLVGQQVGYDKKPLSRFNKETGETLRHGSMACWYAAACMVSYYYKVGPRKGLPKEWAADRGLLSTADINELAIKEGLQIVPKPAGGLTSEALLQLLKTYGPLWAAGHYFNDNPEAKHAIVIIGVRDHLVIYNDPWEPKEKIRSSVWISSNLLPLPGALLAKNGVRTAPQPPFL
jgi:Papain-like cysteine protease AvrRpt2